MIVTFCEQYDITADMKCGSISVDARSIMGVMELIGHDVDLIILGGMMKNVLNLITELYKQSTCKVKEELNEI